MKTYLYIMDNEIKTLEEIRSWYEIENDTDIFIPDNEMELIIHTDLWDTVKVIDDDILSWCNKYADLVSADRYLSQEEKNDSIKQIYEAIRDKDSIILPEVKRIINEGIESNDEDFIKLKEELEKLDNNGDKTTKRKRSGR